MDMNTSVFDRVPPHDEDAEKCVLGGMLINADVVGDVSALLKVKDFYNPRHQKIYEVILSMFAESQPIDAVLVANKLRTEEELEKVGGIDYLRSLIDAVPTAANSVYYAQNVYQTSVLRNIIETGTRIAQLGYSASVDDAENIVNLAQSEAYEMGSSHIDQDYASIGTIVQDTLQQIEDIQNHRINPGVLTGFQNIDEVTRGLQPGQLIIVAGRPAMGKSTLAMDFTRAATFGQNLTTIVFSLEMNRMELTQRVLSAQLNIPLEALRRAENLTIEQWGQLNNAMTNFEKAPLFIDDSPNMSLMEIRAKCRRLKQTRDLKLVVIDYLQLMVSTKQTESRQQEVSEFSRALKLLAKELNIPVVALSQLNRGPEMRTDKRPMLSDLRESGSIEQDADMVFLVHRPDVYDRENRPGEADIILAKHRNGPTDTFPLAFAGMFSKFKNMSQTTAPPVPSF